MKLTAREKILLGVLAVVGIIALLYMFMFKPQMEKLANLAIERNVTSMQVAAVKADLAGYDGIVNSCEETVKTINEITKPFFPEIIEDRIIVLLNRLIEENSVEAGSASFSVIQVQPAHVEASGSSESQFPAKDLINQYKQLIGETVASKETSGGSPSGSAESAEVMSVVISYKATYEQLMSFIKSLEALKRTLVLRNMSVGGSEGGELSGSINLDFYALPKLEVQDSQYYDWPFSGKYGTNNPF